ncbi:MULTISPECIES: DUF6364 family protein [unclassified Imperialibacter]|uniref:DUF6364 family protein n=1 Tax=unclassified Imperialibacter TaxID=2629706 RepID=UPI001254E41B|nr:MULTISPECIES: DUF6364 family protein [unclassified Imperialibacter]CAD5274348.1 conserved hypothetical protein [Imperialibacter sp. 89]CAD5282861.1 conserved hypothetical protein [Imperialibacter sp. 75]VVT22449.1 conserved hypothetical protein [Imperialibacter sp. EC-SDR9]
MEKLTLSVRDKSKISWAKSFAKMNNTSLSQLFETYIDSLIQFDEKKVTLSKEIKSLKQPGQRPNAKEIERHLQQRRNRVGKSSMK